MSSKSANSDRRTASLLAIALVAALGFAPSAHAQTAAPRGGYNPGTSGGAGFNTGNGLESNTALEAQRRLFDTDSDSINFEEGTMVYKGKTINLGGSRFMRARWDRYLNEPVNAKEMAEYTAILVEIERRLANSGEFVGRQAVEDAWNLLFQAAKYPQDGGACFVIANHIYNSYRLKDEVDSSKVDNLELERRRKWEQQIVANRAAMEKLLAEQDLKPSSSTRPGTNRTPRPQPGKTPAKTSTLPDEASFRALDLIETEARIKSLQVKMATNAVQAKLMFQSAIVTLIAERRFQQALIAIGFYRQIFSGAAQKLEVKSEDLNKILPLTENLNSVDALGFLCQEAITETRRGIAAVNSSMDQGNLVAATERLQETLFVGENSLPVIGFDFERKQRVREVYNRGREIQSMIDLKDYNAVEELAKQLDELAPDFPSRQVLSAVETAKRASNLELFAAQTAFATKDTANVKTHLENAAKIWPQNPALVSFTENIVNIVDDTQRAILAFDELMKSGSKRQVFDRRNELGVGLRNDTKRAEKLKQIVNDISMIEFAIGVAEAASEQKNFHTAWETLAEVQSYDPDDVKLNKALRDVAPKVASYVQKLETARLGEEEGNPAAALNAYLAAREEYPISKICNKGIKRTSARILADAGKRMRNAEDKAAKAAASKAPPTVQVIVPSAPATPAAPAPGTPADTAKTDSEPLPEL